MKCCGVLSADDWRQNVTQPDWDPASVVKPAGCCRNKKDDKALQICSAHSSNS